MTDEERRQQEAERQQKEAERLQQEIEEISAAIVRVERENEELEEELQLAIMHLRNAAQRCRGVGNATAKQAGKLAEKVQKVDLETQHVFDALKELISQYSTYKSMTTAAKNLTKYNDEYHTKFAHYNELRRISLGCVIGLDSTIISGETSRKKVEMVYLQNTEYWLAYAAMSVMLWASDEYEAAMRAMEKSLSAHYFNSCLFYLLINLRFNRIDAAKKWYVQYLERSDMDDLGDEWQYLLQAYLFGAFGSDKAFQDTVAQCFRRMMAQVEVTSVDFAKQFVGKAIEFAERYPHKSERSFPLLRRTCSEYRQLHQLLTEAEKNSRIAGYYKELADAETKETQSLPERIENVLYTLVDDYDDEEWEVVKQIHFNEAIISALGDEAVAAENCRSLFADHDKKKNLGGLLLSWAFAGKASQADVSVKRFSISLMKEHIARGYAQFAEGYRAREPRKCTFTIDGCTVTCGEKDLAEGEALLDAGYEKNKLRNLFRDARICIYSAMSGVALLLLMTLLLSFRPAVLTIGVLLGLAGGCLLWQRIVAMGKILEELKRRSKLLLAQALDELAQWRSAYAEADARSEALQDVLAGF